MQAGRRCQKKPWLLRAVISPLDWGVLPPKLVALRGRLHGHRHGMCSGLVPFLYFQRVYQYDL